MIKKTFVFLSTIISLFFISSIFKSSPVHAQTDCCNSPYRYCDRTTMCTSAPTNASNCDDPIYTRVPLNCAPGETCVANVTNPRGTCTASTSPSPTSPPGPTNTPTNTPTLPPSPTTPPPAVCTEGGNCCRCNQSVLPPVCNIVAIDNCNAGLDAICGPISSCGQSDPNSCNCQIPPTPIPGCPYGYSCITASTPDICQAQSGLAQQCLRPNGVAGNCCTPGVVPGYGACVGHFTHLPGECHFFNCPHGMYWDGINPPYSDTGCGTGYSCCLSVTPTSVVRPPLNPVCTTTSGDTGINTAVGCIATTNTNSLLIFLLPWAIGLSGGIALILIIVAAFLVMTSQGNPQRVQAGKELLVSAIIGLMMIIFSVFLLDLIGIRILRLPGL